MNKAYYTSTTAIISKYERETNPVTKSVYRTILGSRIDRQELFRLETLTHLEKIADRLDKCRRV